MMFIRMKMRMLKMMKMMLTKMVIKMVMMESRLRMINLLMNIDGVDVGFADDNNKVDHDDEYEDGDNEVFLK